MLVKEAKKITGSMTRTKKMPGLSYSLPAWECITGKKLRAVKGSVCAGCYALKGNYTRYPAIKAGSVLQTGQPDEARLGPGNGCTSEAPSLVQVARCRGHPERQASH